MVTFLGEGRDQTPQNLIVLGAPGVGKSLVLNKLLRETELLYPFTAIIEVGLAQAAYTRGLGAEPFVSRLDGVQTLNAFDSRGLPLSAFQRSALTATVLRMTGVPREEDHERRRSALIARHAVQLHDLAYAYFRPDEHLTLSAFREYLELAPEDEEECRWLATLLTPWCRGGNCGVLFDGVSNVNLDGPVVHYELGALPESARDIKAVVGFQIINAERQRILSLPRAWRKRFIIEEVSRFLDVPGAATILRELFEQFRKFNCQVTLVAQSYGGDLAE